MKKPLFILGMGAQRTGSTWLFNLLSKQEQVNLGVRKEYDVLGYQAALETFKAKEASPKKETSFVDKYLLLLGKQGEISPEKGLSAEDWLLNLMQKRPMVYEYFFRGLINEKSGIIATGDLSPSNFVLPEKFLAQKKNNLEKCGFRVKALLVIRDPIDRTWSAYKMKRKINPERYFKDDDRFTESYFSDYMRNMGSKMNTNYPRTIKNLQNVFDDDEIFCAIFEDLFNFSTISKLADFLNIEINSPDFSTRINSYDSLPLNEKRIIEAFQYFKPLYDWAHEKFPITRQLWHGDHGKTLV